MTLYTDPLGTLRSVIELLKYSGFFRGSFSTSCWRFLRVDERNLGLAPFILIVSNVLLLGRSSHLVSG